MTIAFFSAQYLPTAGGVERYTWNAARCAVAAGHRALVVTSALPGLPRQEIDADGIEIFRLPVFAFLRGRFPVLQPSHARTAASKSIFAEIQPDLCVIQTRMYTESLWAARQAKKHHLRAIVIDHSTGFMPVGGGLIGWAGRCYERWACRCIQKSGVQFYGVSRAACRWLTSFGIAPAGELPNAVDPDALCAEADTCPTNWRKRAGFAPDKRLVVFVGRMIAEKGPLALAQAVSDMPNTALILAGGGPLLKRLQSFGSKNLFCAGELSHAEVLSLLRQADVSCLPTRYGEGFPTTLLEAAALGCPIVCTPTAGTEELFPGEGYGVLLADASPRTIRAGLLTLLENEPLRHRCAEAARANVLQHFTWSTVFAKIVEIAQGRF